MTTYLILIKLLCAHLCADFLFQTDRINVGKRKAGVEGLGYLLVHSLIHALLAYLFVARWGDWVVPVVVLVTHFSIDWAKVSFFGQGLTPFLIDQLCHIAVIALLWAACYAPTTCALCLSGIDATRLWIVATAYILMLSPSSILLSIFLRKWTPPSLNTQSLPNAGQWIGYLERTLILTFVLVGSFEGVGFLLAAKSVFRFGELSKAHEIRTTEYVLIGTLSSFTLAIITGIAVSRMI